MIFDDNDLLNDFRTAGECELCGKFAARREPHHAFSKGACGGAIDVPENLVAVSGHDTFACHCHRKIHDGAIPRKCVLSVIALREGYTVDQLERFIYAIRRAAKGTDLDTLRREIFLLRA